MINDILLNTMVCDCGGNDNCKECRGTGVKFDERFFQLVAKNAPGLSKGKIALFITDVYYHINNKITEAYNRGKEDGAMELKKLQDESILENENLKIEDFTS